MEEKEDSSELKNITEYIGFLKSQIEIDKNNRKRRVHERELQVEEAKLKSQIDNLIKENKRHKDLIEDSEEIDDEEKQSRKELIKENDKKIEKMEERYLKVKSINEENRKRQKEHPNIIEPPEEHSRKIVAINERIYQFSLVQEFLTSGDSFDEAIQKLIQWQRQRYKLGNNKDRYIIEQDIDGIHEDEKIANEIIDVAIGEKVNTRDSYDER